MAAREGILELRGLIARCRWLALATTADGGAPASSYVPFAPCEGAFAIAVSRLSAHTRHLAARPGASVLLVDGVDAEAGDFARARLAVDVVARFITDEAASSLVWNALEARFGATVATLRDLPDFATVLLEPGRGRAILGFAMALDVDSGQLRAALTEARARE